MKKLLEKKIKQVLTISMALSVIFCTNAFATPIDLANSTESVATDTLNKAEGTDYFDDEDTNVWNEGEITERVDVTVQRESQFEITIPKDIVLNGETGTADYIVNAKGDIAGDQVLKVVPDAEFEMTEAGGKDSVTATVTQPDTEYTYQEMLDEGTDYPGSVAATLTAGEWVGKFAFNILFKGSDVNKPSEEPEDDELYILSYTTITGTTITTGFNNVEDLKNISSNNSDIKKATLELNPSETTPKQDLSDLFKNDENLIEVILIGVNEEYISSVTNIFVGSPNIEKVYVRQSFYDKFEGIADAGIIEIVDRQDTSLPAKGKQLEDYTWVEIAAISEAGEAENYFNLGDEKKFQTTENGEFTAQIIGFNHDNLADGSGKAGITFQFKEAKFAYNMSSADVASNSGGWTSSLGREFVNDYVFSDLETELQNEIKEVTKKSDLGALNSTDTVTTDDKLFLLSAEEVGLKPEYNDVITTSDFTDNIVLGLGETYPFFEENFERIYKSDGYHNVDWWLRSTPTNSNTCFHIVSSYGSGWSTTADAYTYAYVIPAFCI